jgi:hypothetical protein
MTKQVKLVILIFVVLFLGYLGYSVYFTSKEGTESFSKFDPNSTANKTITVEIVHEKGFIQGQGGGVAFYAKDRTGAVMKITYDKELTQEIKNAKTVTLLGHVHGDYFHAADITPN